jgi:two-component system response regulator MprA
VLMPGLDGITVCRRLRESGDRTPILMLTARDANYPEHEGSLRVGDLELNPRTRQVTRGDRAVELTRTEFALLELLMRNAGVVLTRDVIRERVWGFGDSYGSNTLDVYIGYLRRKTGAGGEARVIHTVRGLGFVLRDT